MRVEEAIGTHDLIPAGRSSIGVYLLAHRPPAAGITGSPTGNDPTRDPPADEHTLAGDDLAEAVASARHLGYGRRDYPTGDISLAVGVGAPLVAGIAISGIIDEDDVEQLVGDLQDTAALITKDLTTAFARTPGPRANS